MRTIELAYVGTKENRRDETGTVNVIKFLFRYTILCPLSKFGLRNTKTVRSDKCFRVAFIRYLSLE